MHQVHNQISLCPRVPYEPIKPELPEDEPFDSARLEAARDKAIHALLLLAALLISMLGYFIWDHWQTGRVEASSPIGRLIGVAATGGRPWPVVIQTERGFFPLREAVSIQPGAALLLEDRTSGDRFVCDLQRTVCVQSSRHTLGAVR